LKERRQRRKNNGGESDLCEHGGMLRIERLLFNDKNCFAIEEADG
jgi:hypothetical protein